MHAILEALHFSFSTFILQTINLLVVMGILYLLLYKPVTQVLIEREQKIEGSLRDAAQAREEAEAALAKYQEQLKGARQEAQEIVDRATKMGEEMKQEIIAKAKEEAEKTLERAKTEIQGEKAKALTEIRGEIATLAVLAAGKVIDKSLTKEDHEKLISDFLEEVGEVQ